MEKEKKVYEKPAIEVVEFTIEESIAQSGQSMPGLTCTEDI